MGVELLPSVKAADLVQAPAEHRWLVRPVWGRQAQGFIGGAPKLGKSWLGLDLAVSVASATPCLGRFEVEHPGPALVYLAEDALPDVRARIHGICLHRGVDLASLDLRVLTVPVLRLDQGADPARLDATIAHLRPRVLVLDPLVRMHRLDENSAQDISGLLGFLTELGRRYDLAVVLVHHTSKKHRARLGQALRGSSDLHAWGSSNAYLHLVNDDLLLTLEHRTAPPPDPVRLKLVSRPDGTATHLEVVGGSPDPKEPSLPQRILTALGQAERPLLRHDLRERLRVNNNRLGEVLTHLEQTGRVQRASDGWSLVGAGCPAA